MSVFIVLCIIILLVCLNKDSKKGKPQRKSLKQLHQNSTGLNYKEKAEELVVFVRKGYEIPYELDKDRTIQNQLIKYAQCVNWYDNAEKDFLKAMAKFYDTLLKYEGIDPPPTIKINTEHEQKKEEIRRFEETCILQKENPLEYLTQMLYRWHLYLGSQEELRNKLSNMIDKIEKHLNIKFSLVPLTETRELPEDDYKEPLLSLEELKEIHKLLNFEGITKIIERKKTGSKNKNEYFYDENGNKCSTEKVVLSYLESQGYEAIYAENSYWKALAVLSYFEEIYSQNWNGFAPFVNNMGTSFMYKENKQIFDNKTLLIEKCNLKQFIQNQIDDFGFMCINDFRCQGTDYIEYLQKHIEFLDYIPNQIFTKIVSRMIIYLAEYGRGLPDLLAHKDNQLCLIEVKRTREKIREAQENWIVYLRKNNIPIEIIRVKGV